MPRTFHLEIDSMEEFAVFLALVRGDALDEDRLKALVARLHGASDALAAAEKADETPRVP